MKKIILVAGRDHRKVATQLKQVLLGADIELHTITIKSSSELVSKLAQKLSQAIWLVSPQTIEDTQYKKIQALLKQRGVSILPVIVTPVANNPFTQASVRLNKSPQITANSIVQALDTSNQPSVLAHNNRRLIGTLILLAIVVIGVSTLALSPMLQPPAESLPTFVALNKIPVATVLAVTDDQTTATSTDDSTSEIGFDLAVTATSEMTEEVAVTATPDVMPESTEAVDLVEVTDEPSDSPTSELGGILLADFSADPQRGDAPLRVNVTNLSTGDMSAYRWDYESDGIIDSSDFEPTTIIYETPGIYTLTLTTRDIDGNIVQSQSVIEVFDNQDVSGSKLSSGSAFASFETSPSSGQFPLTVRFKNRSVGSDITYEWDFDGDSRVDFIGPSPSAYVYKQPGTYTARLIAIAPNGTRDTAQAQINVYSASPDSANNIVYDVDSQANFQVSVSTGTVPFRVSINNLSLGGNNSYEWDFDGDGHADSASSQPPSQRYAKAGVYTVSLTVYGFDRYGVPKVSRAQTQIQAMAMGSNTPVDDETYEEFGMEADFVATAFEGTAPLTVEFYNYSTGDISGYQWDFNKDGVVDSVEFEPVYTFKNAGIFEVVLKVTDGVTTSETSFDIQVFAPQVSPTPIPTQATLATTTPTKTPTTGGATSTKTLTPTVTPTISASVTNATAVPSATPSGGVTVTQATATHTFTAMPSVTPTSSPTFTFTPTATQTATRTPTPIPTATQPPTAIPTNTATFTPIPTSTPLPSETPVEDS